MPNRNTCPTKKLIAASVLEMEINLPKCGKSITVLIGITSKSFFSFYRQLQNIAYIIHNIFAIELKKCMRQLMSMCVM